MVSTLAYAPPGVWGFWIKLHSHFGPFAYTVSYDTESEAPSSFDVEVRYATNDGMRTEKSWGPGSFLIQGNDGAGRDEIRFRSHTVGQMIRLQY